MTIPLIAEEDLECLTVAFPKLDFTDPECRTVLLANGKVDVQAAPGSGKTTILAAKLYLLSRKWASDRQGICVISHTNTAANEIRHRLAGTSEGVRLLAYPHFIGTIHGFVNHFLALPRLRSDGGTVDVIDDEVFAKRARSRARANGTTRAWADYQSGNNELIGQMRFSGADLEIVSGKNFPSSGSASGKHLRKVKRDLAIEGIFRHIDMFAFAERALAVTPRLASLLARRFPLVMIDEMQDTSPSQTALLTKAFDRGAVVQRFGDINQRIFFSDDEDEDEDGAPFPEDPQLPMSTSRRFGPTIAAIVSSVREKGSPVVGKGPDVAAPPTLLVYTEQTLERVIPHFGELVLDAFDDETIANGGHIRAICARRSGESKEMPGRHVGDFWPPLAINPKTAAPKGTNAWRLLAEDAGMGRLQVELGDRSERMRRIVLLALREAKAPIADDVREPWRLFRALREQDLDLRPLRRAMRDVVMDKDSGSTDITRIETIRRLYQALAPLMSGITLEAFAVLPVFADPTGDDEAPVSKSQLRTGAVEANGRFVNVTVDTVGNTKGETQLATLYLESIGRYSKRFDVVEAIARQTGRKTVKGKPLKTLPAQMRYAYVGFSRPTRFLCLAINSERLNTEDQKILIGNGWRVESLG
ncbi:AAA family ATPase [Xanthomonas hyacinthi]|uniref:UvrD-like helicase ATP-binding domain-containing protein n=1 Tax=Xanthomonas hyacinthi TaxID=56455 RepID=A0A2S7EPG4_9XANT|nr:UvrD-helicase domain-containing protein [Xanthomonas hyacinthi]KLD77070.1 hypothetical protein Y886_17825 [Xanthomonas hyacinthi DSM 19077]PPU94425.1 hypothetical protein XhyaCFBP1156_20165 [Xanthomonas hyacinthi]QGY78865.1 AAA family ATPase [Xanthomonas hyacinthi]